MFYLQCTFFVFFYLWYWAYAYLRSEKNISECPWLVLFAFSGQYLQAEIRMLVTTATKETFKPLRRTHVLVWSVMIFQLATHGAYLSETQVFGFATGLSWTVLSHQILFSLLEMKAILGLNILTIGNKRRSLPTTPTTPSKVRSAKGSSPSSKISRTSKQK